MLLLGDIMDNNRCKTTNTKLYENVNTLYTSNHDPLFANMKCCAHNENVVHLLHARTY